jgi:CBS domain-containing protein/gamma-glutamylcysteine synthetase
MGRHDVEMATGEDQRRAYMRALLRDVEALEIMLREGMIESGTPRIGAEQEMALIDRAGHPAPIGTRLLERLPAEFFTTELGKFNIEMNLPPLTWGGSALREMERQINTLLTQARAAAQEHDALIVLTGILPSLTKTDLSLSNLTDAPRYHRLNEALNRLRGGPYELNIVGVDELNIKHDSVMLEACNTSFQVHFQVEPAEFPRWYNLAQAATAPVLAAAVNSPLLLGRRLWRETRIALFQQSIDTRGAQAGMREFQPRVSFGNAWIRESVLEIYQEDIARFKPLFHEIPDEDALEMLERGDVPRLGALCLHNGTVYRWNRACYGVSEGRPHLRIENRVLPSGPTPVDEVANAALWLGLLRGLADTYEDITRHLSFDDVFQNFVAAARHGLEAQLTWIGKQHLPARELLALKVLPLAHNGLRAAGIDSADIDRYLGVIEKRVATGQTGANWALRSVAEAGLSENRAQALCRLSSAIAHRQLHNAPVHTWEPLHASEFIGDRRHYMKVGQYMTTDLFTVHQDDVIELVTNLMDWKHIRHVPVEDDDHALVGLVSHRDLLRYLGRARDRGDARAVPVSEIMKPNPVTADPETTTIEAIRTMQERQVACLPVVEDGKLVGVITEHDLMRIAAPLLERFLGE